MVLYKYPGYEKVKEQIVTERIINVKFECPSNPLLTKEKLMELKKEVEIEN